MQIPESYIKIMAAFQRAVKTGDSAEIDKIQLVDIKLAKAHLSCDSKQPFYVFMVDYIQDREKREQAGSNSISIGKEDYIFISHISEEKSPALLLKEFLKSLFNNVPVFVSSDYESIRSGNEWYETIVKSARSAKIILVFLSKQSTHQPWINFEAGIGAGTFGEVIPIVGRNLRIDDIPHPLQVRQARDLRDPEGVAALLRDISKMLNQTEPTGDWSTFTREFLGIVKQLPYEGLFLEPYCVQGDNGKSNTIQFRLINNGTTDMNLIAVESSVPENLLLQNWARPNSIPNLSKATVEQNDGKRRLRYACYAYSGPIPPGYGYPDRLPDCLTPSMSPHDFPTLRFVLRGDLSDEDLNQTLEYKVLAREFITEVHVITIRELLARVCK